MAPAGPDAAVLGQRSGGRRARAARGGAAGAGIRDGGAGSSQPALAEQPLVLGTPKQGAWRVAALSAAAAEAGVRIGMPLAQAESLCPTLVRRPLDTAYLARESERLLAALEAHVAVEPADLGGAWLGAGVWGIGDGEVSASPILIPYLLPPTRSAGLPGWWMR